MKASQYILIMIAANVSCIGFLLLAAWFAYLENGHWGWPFAYACFTAMGFKTAKERMEEEREEKIKRAQAAKKYGLNFDN